MSSEAEQRIEARLPKLREHFQTPQTVWPALAQILSQPHAPLAARAMHETGVLEALFPELQLRHFLAFYRTRRSEYLRTPGHPGTLRELLRFTRALLRR